MGGQMQNVRRMDLEQRFFCRLFGREVGRRPAPVGKLLYQFISFFLRAFQAPETPILDFPSFAAADRASISVTVLCLGQHWWRTEIKIRISKQNDFFSC